MAGNIEWYYVDATRSQQGPKTIKELHQAAEGRSGTFPQITFEEHIGDRLLIIASNIIENKWQTYLTLHFKQLYNRRDENKTLQELQSVLLSKMSKVEETATSAKYAQVEMMKK